MLSCGHSIPHSEILSAAAVIYQARRTKRAGGPPSIPTICFKCGELCEGRRAAENHCRKKRVTTY